jgi:hypothetical protein
VRALVRLQKLSVEQAMSRGLDIANRLQKKFTTAGVHRLDVVFLCTFSPVRGRKVYMLNQPGLSVSSFFFAVAIPAKGFGTVVRETMFQ